jgi:hypothetical protein
MGGELPLFTRNVMNQPLMHSKKVKESNKEKILKNSGLISTFFIKINPFFVKEGSKNGQLGNVSIFNEPQLQLES